MSDSLGALQMKHPIMWLFRMKCVDHIATHHHHYHHNYCVTRAPLLYFIRSWVALSFKVCERVSESIRDPWHWVEPTGSSLRLCLLFVLCPVLKDDKQIYPIRMIQFKTWTCWKNHIMAIFGALCHLCKANFCSWRNNQDDLWTIHRKVGVRSFANSKKSV